MVYVILTVKSLGNKSKLYSIGEEKLHFTFLY